MATDFFQRQDTARRQTLLLVMLFAVSVGLLIAALYVVAAVAFAGAMDQTRSHGEAGWWHPELLLAVAAAALTVIGLGSLYKVAELAAGGQKIALMMGGRQIQSQTRDLAERRFLNVVEEMALASGVAVPPVYVLDGEPGINAFAAGHRPDEAVVAVSRGALRYLNRDELQGVVAHEFSHILNGDMRLNLRLIGVVHGILVISIIGYYIFRITVDSSGRSRSSKKEGGAVMAILVLGLALMVLGYVGTLCGRIIKSAISRQREYLADASAVQFTRNPSGIAGALKKIGSLAEGSRMRDVHAAEISHMFFGDAFAGSWFNLFATHPPLVERIRRLDTEFDGQFPEIRPVEGEEEMPAAGPAEAESEPSAPSDQAEPLVAAVVAEGSAATPPGTRRALPRSGTLQPEQVSLAGKLLANLPPALAAAAREPYSARALIYALLLSRDARTRERQLECLQSRSESLCYQETLRLAETLASVEAVVRLPLVELAAPSLRHLAAGQYRDFRETVEAMVAADGQMDLFEYSLRTVLFASLDVAFGLVRPPAVHYRALGPLREPLAMVLSALAYAGHSEAERAAEAFAAATADLPKTIQLRPAEQCTLTQFDLALRTLAQGTPAIRKRVLAAATTCVASDGRLTLREAELLRVVGAALGCPIGLVAN